MRSYLLSGHFTLGALMTDRSGAFEGSLPVSPALVSGADALQINGFTPDRQVRSVTVGVNVLSPALEAEAQAKVRFAQHSARLTSASKRELKSLIGSLSSRGVTRTTITGVYCPLHGDRGRGLAKKRSAKVMRYLSRRGIQGSLGIAVKPVRVTDYSRGRRVVVRAYYTVPESRS